LSWLHFHGPGVASIRNDANNCIVNVLGINVVPNNNKRIGKTNVNT